MRADIVLKYKLEKLRLGAIIFLITLALIIGLGCSVKILSAETVVSINGIDGVIAMFLIAYGVSDYIETFKFFQGMNLSREDYFKGILKSFFIISICAAVIGVVFYSITTFVSDKQTLLEMLVFWGKSGNINIILNFIWFALISFFSLSLGTFIGILYFKASNLKITIVSISLIVVINSIVYLVIAFNEAIRKFCSSATSILILTLILGIAFTLVNKILIKKCKMER